MLRRRYEILLPLTNNDNRPISAEKFYETRNELIGQFGAVSMTPGTVLGEWIHEHRRYEDESLRLLIDVADTPENRQFFIDFKQVLCNRFEQIEIYIISYPVDVL